MSTESELNIFLENQVGVIEINRAPNNHFDHSLFPR